MTHAELFDLVVDHGELADLDPAQRRLALRALVGPHVAPGELGPAVKSLADDIDGLGPLTDLTRDERVTDVLVNGPNEVWVERAGELQRTEVCFSDSVSLRALVDRVVGAAGGRVDASHPIADVRLSDGARLHVVLPPVAPTGPLLSIRRFATRPPPLSQLVDSDHERTLAAAVPERKGILISGATGAGKTTLLNALLSLVSDGERVVTIEETPELRPACAHSVALVARPPNLEGRGAVELDVLVRAALRMRPDRIVIGEVRGAEALLALQATATGHVGSMLTVHAGCPSGAVDRLVGLALGAASGISERSLRSMLRAGFDLVVHLERIGGKRRVSEIVDVDRI